MKDSLSSRTPALLGFNPIHLQFFGEILKALAVVQRMSVGNWALMCSLLEMASLCWSAGNTGVVIDFSLPRKMVVSLLRISSYFLSLHWWSLFGLSGVVSVVLLNLYLCHSSKSSNVGIVIPRGCVYLLDLDLRSWGSLLISLETRCDPQSSSVFAFWSN